MGGRLTGGNGILGCFCICFQPFACLLFLCLSIASRRGQVWIRRTGAWMGGAVNIFIQPAFPPPPLKRHCPSSQTKSYDVALFTTAKSFVSFANSSAQTCWAMLQPIWKRKAEYLASWFIWINMKPTCFPPEQKLTFWFRNFSIFVMVLDSVSKNLVSEKVSDSIP